MFNNAINAKFIRAQLDRILLETNEGSGHNNSCCTMTDSVIFSRQSLRYANLKTGIC